MITQPQIRPFDKAVAEWFKTDFVSALNPRLDRLIARLNATTAPSSSLARKAAGEIHRLCDQLAPETPNDSTSYAPTADQIAAIIERCLSEGEA